MGIHAQYDPEELVDGYYEEYSAAAQMEQGCVSFLLSFLERAIRDYIELDPTSHRKSSEFSDGYTAADEWMSAARFLHCEERVMPPLDVTFRDICDILDINVDTILSRVEEEVGDYRNKREGTER